MPVLPSILTLLSHEKSFFHSRLNPLTLCFLMTRDRHAFSAIGSLDTESSSDELHDLSAIPTLDNEPLEELGTLPLVGGELRKLLIVCCDGTGDEDILLS